MRALELASPGDIRLREMPLPDLEPGDLLIEVVSATTCGTDLKAWRRGHPQIPMPGPFGHEYSGIVVAVGEGTEFDVGQAVMGVHSAPCQACLWCQSGQENLCVSIMQTKVLGTYAEYVRIPARIARLNIFPKPDDLPFDQAALLEPLACVAQGILLLPGVEKENVLVIGPGAIGLMFVAVLVNAGAKVTLAGRNGSRLAIGEAFGARVTSLEAAASAFDTVIECTGAAEVWEQSIDFPRRGGRVMLFGGCPSGTRVTFSAGRLHYDQIQLISPFHFGTDAVRLAHRWLTAQGIDLSPLISGERRLDQAEAVFEDLAKGNGVKYVFKP